MIPRKNSDDTIRYEPVDAVKTSIENVAPNATKTGQKAFTNGVGEGIIGSGGDAAASAETKGFGEGAGETSKFESWDDFSRYIQDVGKDTSLTIAEKVRKIQRAYNGIADKTDINIPISDKYVKGFDADGKIEYDWPGYLGFDKKTITSISRSNLLPETWDRTGGTRGRFFCVDITPGIFYNIPGVVIYVTTSKKKE